MQQGDTAYCIGASYNFNPEVKSVTFERYLGIDECIRLRGHTLDCEITYRS